MRAAEKYRLAYAAMKGDKSAREKLGNPKTFGELHAIMCDAFDGLSDDEQSADLDSVERELGQIDGRKPGD